MPKLSDTYKVKSAWFKENFPRVHKAIMERVFYMRIFDNVDGRTARRLQREYFDQSIKILKELNYAETK